MRKTVLTIFVAVTVAFAQENPSEACAKALTDCENDLECQNRLAPMMAACTTGTCQPQCRSAVLNVYQNKLGRILLRSDATCIPGRDELRTCNFLPAESTVHCSLGKLACEGDLQCNSKFGVFMSECEADAAKGACNEKCKTLLKQTIETSVGSVFSNCTCTARDDQLCTNLKDNLLGVCLKNAPGSATLSPSDNSITDAPAGNDLADSSVGTNFQFALFVYSLIALFF
uniref:GDNF/GAS1 domain-containing protein n=1 Tax=Caenorhabditis japonica TaxID=281687 RepID=A0A8R1IEY0_CAEJA